MYQLILILTLSFSVFANQCKNKCNNECVCAVGKNEYPCGKVIEINKTLVKCKNKIWVYYTPIECKWKDEKYNDGDMVLTNTMGWIQCDKKTKFDDGKWKVLDNMLSYLLRCEYDVIVKFNKGEKVNTYTVYDEIVCENGMLIAKEKWVEDEDEVNKGWNYMHSKKYNDAMEDVEFY